MSRNPNWNQQRKFTRGEVFFVDLPEEPKVDPDPSRVMKGDHRCVVLFDSTFPRKTVTILPITSLYDASGKQKDVISTDLVLKLSDYQNADSTYNKAITKDSLIRTEQIRTISRHLLERKTGNLLPKDMLKLDMLLIDSLQLQSTVSKIVQHEVERRLAGMQQNQNHTRSSGLER